MYLALTLAILKHEVTRKYILKNVLYPWWPLVSILDLLDTRDLSIEIWAIVIIQQSQKKKKLYTPQILAFGQIEYNFS